MQGKGYEDKSPPHPHMFYVEEKIGMIRKGGGGNNFSGAIF